MFKDKIYPVEIGRSNHAQAEGSRTIDIRIDVDVPVRDYALIDAVLGETVVSAAESDAFKQLQWSVTSKPFQLIFAPTQDALGDADIPTVLHDVAIDKKIIVVRKKDDDEGYRLVLQLSTSIPYTEANNSFAGCYYKNDSYCRFIESQTELPLDKKGEKDKCNKEQVTA